MFAGDFPEAEKARRFHGAEDAKQRAEDAKQRASASWKRRRAAYLEAEANTRWQDHALARQLGVEPPLLGRYLARAIVDLAFRGPHEVTLVWMGPRSRANELTAGESLRRARTVVIPSFQDACDVATAGHELGHQFANVPAGAHRLIREIAAWQWAVRNVPLWNERADELLRSALKTYIDSEPKDTVGIIAAERFCVEERLRRVPARAALDRFERMQFTETHGVVECASLVCAHPRRLARYLVGSTPVCPECRGWAQKWRATHASDGNTAQADGKDDAGLPG